MTPETSAQVTELTADDHACLTFGEPEELFDLTAAFVRDGLDAGVKVVWLSDASPAQAAGELARRGVTARPALGSGQMVAAGYEDRLLSGAAFRSDTAVRWLTGQVEAARDEGFPGLRCGSRST